MQPARLAPYFWFATLVHAVAVATRFDALAAKLPAAAPIAILLIQVPLIVLSGYFEGALDYGPGLEGFPRWMQIRSRPVKLAMTFGFIYLCCVTLQTWNLSLGPIDPTPPLVWSTGRRAAWFAMFTAGMFFPFYLAATGLLVPALRTLTAPMRVLPRALGALFALAFGGAVGVGVSALVTWTRLGAFVTAVKAAIAADPATALGVTLGGTFGPMLIGVALARLREPAPE